MRSRAFWADILRSRDLPSTRRRRKFTVPCSYFHPPFRGRLRRCCKIAKAGPTPFRRTAAACPNGAPVEQAFHLFGRAKLVSADRRATPTNRDGPVHPLLASFGNAGAFEEIGFVLQRREMGSFLCVAAGTHSQPSPVVHSGGGALPVLILPGTRTGIPNAFSYLQPLAGSWKTKPSARATRFQSVRVLD